jgi:hypothetical protein
VNAQGKGFDFTALGTDPYSFFEPSQEFRYDFLFCAEQSCDKKVPPTNTASLCQHSINFPDKMVLGKWADTPNVVWTKTDDGAVVDFKDGEFCPDIQANRETQIRIHCGDWETALIGFSETSTCVYQGDLNVPSSVCHGGMSGGWIFIIILLVALFLFFAIGIAYKRFKMGATSWKESVPLIDFWVTLPGLVKDGFAFVFKQKCKRAAFEQVV